MKKSELRFKSVVPNKNAGMCIRLALKNIGLIKNTEDDYAHYQFFAYDRGIIATTNADVFCLWSEPLMSYEDALKLISSIEPDAPEFDIKFSEKCLGRNNIDDSWKAISFGAAGNQAFITLENGSVSMVTPLTRDTFLNKNNIAGWWECENGKPVWRTK